MSGGELIVPGAVAEELNIGRSQGVDLPELGSISWIAINSPQSAVVLPLVTDLGKGETEVLALALESPDPLVLLDDRVARRVALSVGVPFRGTLGILLDAKRAGLIPEVAPLLDRMESLGFRIARSTRQSVLKSAGE